MRALRYFLAGFETLVALFFLVFVGGLIATVQLSIPKNPPLEGARRAVVVAELGRAMVVSVMGGIFAF